VCRSSNIPPKPLQTPCPLPLPLPLLVATAQGVVISAQRTRRPKNLVKNIVFRTFSKQNIIGAIWVILGVILAYIGVILAYLGVILAHIGAIVGPSWPTKINLGAKLAPNKYVTNKIVRACSKQKVSGAILGSSWTIVGSAWPISGSSWLILKPYLGVILAHIGAILAHKQPLGPIWHLGVILGSSWPILGQCGHMCMKEGVAE
jgi:hypothetical protein